MWWFILLLLSEVTGSNKPATGDEAKGCLMTYAVLIWIAVFFYIFINVHDNFGKTVVFCGYPFASVFVLYGLAWLHEKAKK